MPAKPLIDILGKMLKHHRNLHQLALEKRDAIKNGKLDQLNTLINKEMAHISAIEKLDRERNRILAELVPERKNPTLTDCLSSFLEKERQQLLDLREKLVRTIGELQAENRLNQELLELSRQYVEFQLDLLLPREAPNYSKTCEEEEPQGMVSLFDSKA